MSTQTGQDEQKVRLYAEFTGYCAIDHQPQHSRNAKVPSTRFSLPMNSLIKRCVLLLLLMALVDSVHGDTGSASASSDGVVDLSIIESAISSSTGIANASYVKSFTVGPPATQPDVNAVHNMLIFVPGRVFINYVDYQDAGDLVDRTTLMGVSLYSDTPELLDLVTIHGSTWFEELETQIYIDALETNITTLTGNLLVEVSVYRRNQVLELSGGFRSSLEIVVGDGVLHSKDVSPVFLTDSNGFFDAVSGSGSSAFGFAEDSIEFNIDGSTTLYLLSPSTALNLYRLNIFLFDTASIYVEVDSLATSSGISVYSSDSTSIVAFINSLRAGGAGINLALDGDGEACMAVRDTFEVSTYRIEFPQDISFPQQTGGIEVLGTSECVKPQIPPFEPRAVSLENTTFTPSNETSSTSGDSSSSLTNSSSSSSSSNAATSLRPMWLPVAALVLGSGLVVGW